MIDINFEIQKLIQYGKEKGFFDARDEIYVRNKILALLGIFEFEEVRIPIAEFIYLYDNIKNIILWAMENGILTEKGVDEYDRFAAKLMDSIMPRPSDIEKIFFGMYDSSPIEATKYFYGLSVDSYYIKMDRLSKNVKWKFDTEYGKMDITINLAKPEKDPKEIADAMKTVSASYPKCLLCKEAEGYCGNDRFPERYNHRIIQLSLCDEKWFLQYSPYMYYEEHCILLKDQHEDMKISKKTFDRLLEFVQKFPHYFIGSNADLPLVGGSILSHDHFQGGQYEFPMAVSKTKLERTVKGYPGLNIGVLKWPMSVLRLSSFCKEDLSTVAGIILDIWRAYNDEEISIISSTGRVAHNTITPIARKKGDLYEMDLVLRNNRTTDECPYGIFHPHEELHHIKKENIGLIEVMGLAVLPGRLHNEISILKKCLLDNLQDISGIEAVSIHSDWYKEILEKYGTQNSSDIDKIFETEIGDKFSKVLWDCGVFKDDDEGMIHFIKFLDTVFDNIDKE